MITINPNIPAEFLPTKSILATAWEVSKQPVFSIENYIVGRLALNTVNKTSATFSIDESTLLSKDLFVRVQYKFTDGTVSDEDVYKSSIRLNDGSVIRISSSYTGTDKVLMYPASLESIVNPGIEVVTGKLVVHVGETKYLTEVNFEKLVVEGDSPTNTGTLILLIAGKEFTYNYGTIILGKTQTLSAEEKGKYSQVVVVNNTTVRITDAI